MVSKTTLLFAVLLATVYVAQCAPADVAQEQEEAPKQEPATSEERALPEHKDRSVLEAFQEQFQQAVETARDTASQALQTVLTVFSGSK